MPTAPRILVVYKKSAYELHARDGRDRGVLHALRRHDPDALDLRVAHAVHHQTLDAVVRALRRMRLRHDVVYRAHLRKSTGYRLIVSVGGDGTLLQVSHVAGRTPILGVNSDPRRSEAVFCGATRSSFPRLLAMALDDRLQPAELTRLRLRVNGRPIEPLALNDVLIAHDDPATMSRYRLRVGRRVEFQKSSGVWVSTAAGSSSAILAAGGRRLAWTSRQYQYRPREVYRGRLTRGRLAGGILSPRATLEIVWLMREGCAFIDGPHERHALEFGDRLTVGPSPDEPARILGIAVR